MLMVWRVLMLLDQIKSRHVPDLCVKDLPLAYRLRSHGNSRFLLYSTSKNPLTLMATKKEDPDLAPPSVESELRIKEIDRLPDSERTFSLSLISSSQKSSSEMSGKYVIKLITEYEC
ncbi:hypothetical protein Hanom_Chr09g00772701 [Helianthus anomalus]